MPVKMALTIPSLISSICLAEIESRGKNVQIHIVLPGCRAGLSGVKFHAAEPQLIKPWDTPPRVRITPESSHDRSVEAEL